MANGRSLMVLVLAASACDAPAPRVAASPAPITSASSPPARAPAGVPPSPAETAYEALPSECRGDIVKTLTSPSCRVSSPDARADSKGRLELFVSPPMLVVERGEVLHARVRLHNVGATPIVLLLRPDAPWGHAPDRVSSRYVVGTVTDANGLDPSTHEPRIALIQRMDGPLTDAVRAKR